jgi:hypothetical protein
MSLNQTVPLPEPLRAQEEPSFTHHSVVVRLPDIARRVLEENDFPPQAAQQIQSLIDEIPAGKVRDLTLPLGPFAALWADYIRPYRGQNWLQIPWFFAEEYFYARILEASGYFHPGDWLRRDPYAQQKQLGLQSSRAAIRTLAGQVHAARRDTHQDRLESLERFILADLWGNQNDLSMWPVRKGQDGSKMQGGSAVESGSGDDETSQEEAEARLRKHLLADDTPALLDYFAGLDHASARVDILLDNAGYELAADLALAGFMLSADLAAQVTLHTKSHPVFVSDALDADILDTLDFMALDADTHTRALAVDLRRALVSERLRLRHHPFWTSPLPLWDLPANLVADMRGSSLLISKGDANYRRLLGDRHWPQDTPFPRVMAYFPIPVLALRTMKSEIAVGVDTTRVPQDDPDWMINGRWGLIQFYQ